jgi:hypothetical protein
MELNSRANVAIEDRKLRTDGKSLYHCSFWNLAKFHS